MVSLSTPVRRIRLIASSAVMLGRRLTYSVVMMLPALSSGYLRISLIILRVSGSADLRMRLTTLAGISSTMSTASSTYSSSTTSFSSLSEKPRISSSCASGSISTNVSAASSFGSSRKSRGSFSSGISSNTAAMSWAFMVTRMSRNVVYFLPSTRAASVTSIVTTGLSAIGISSQLFVSERRALRSRAGSKTHRRTDVSRSYGGRRATRAAPPHVSCFGPLSCRYYRLRPSLPTSLHRRFCSIFGMTRMVIPFFIIGPPEIFVNRKLRGGAGRNRSIFCHFGPSAPRSGQETAPADPNGSAGAVTKRRDSRGGLMRWPGRRRGRGRAASRRRRGSG